MEKCNLWGVKLVKGEAIMWALKQERKEIIMAAEQESNKSNKNALS